MTPERGFRPRVELMRANDCSVGFSIFNGCNIGNRTGVIPKPAHCRFNNGNGCGRGKPDTLV